MAFIPIVLAFALVSLVTQARSTVESHRRISTGGIELAATLTVPAGPGPHPAIVLLSGSGPSTRQNLRKFSDPLNVAGFATLVYDKRGSGESSGSWTTASFDDNVNDAKAAVATLMADARIDRQLVGVWGVSQAGWFIPALAAHTPDLAFAIVLTGGGATPREVEMFMHEAALDRAGVTSAQRAQARRLLSAYFSWLASGVNRAGVVELMAQARSEPWYRAIRLDEVMPSDANRPRWEWVAKYDPMPFIENMTLPTLVVLGGADQMGSTALAAERWRAGLGRAGNQRASVVVIEGMGHAATIGEMHEQAGAAMPEYTAVVSAFLERLKPR